jgi:hypothetical protein
MHITSWPSVTTTIWLDAGSAAGLALLAGWALSSRQGGPAQTRPIAGHRDRITGFGQETSTVE